MITNPDKFQYSQVPGQLATFLVAQSCAKLVLDIGRLEIIEKKLLLFCVGNELVAGGSGGCEPEKTTAFHGNLRNG